MIVFYPDKCKVLKMVYRLLLWVRSRTCFCTQLFFAFFCIFLHFFLSSL